jgi:LysR family transcriptional regulator, glycine cleavage system transcriptional activator
MTRASPPLNFIRAFEATARHLSFTLAAAELGYTQAAVSTQVRALERYIGKPLFIRKTRSLKLTETGEAFLPTLRQALQQIDNATEAIVTSSREKAVSLACPVSLAENWIPRILPGFHAAHPDIDVVVQATVWETPEHPVSDLAITINRDGEAPPESQRLWPERLVLLASPERAAKIKTPRDIVAQPKIFVLARQDYWTAMAAALSIPSIDLERGDRTNSTNVALEMAACGVGLTVSLESLARIYIERGLLAEPLSMRPASPWSYYLKPSVQGRTPHAERLRSWIVRAAAAKGAPPAAHRP